MWEELADVGVRPLATAEEVDQALAQNTGTALCIINSVCGCAAGGARPGVTLALQNELIPDELVTVFAGMDQEAVARARHYMEPVPPSSPCIAIFENGKPIHVLERRHIERMTAIDIANNLRQVFNEKCTGKGPSVPPEVFDNNESIQACGSTIDPYKG